MPDRPPDRSVVLRPMAAAHASAIRPLLEQLGYALTPQEVARRLATVLGRSDHAAFVASAEDRVVGFVHVYARPALDKPPEAVVQALVVDATYRKGGIGKLLMNGAERWAAAQGFTSVALYSHVRREEAHAFYRGIGYGPAGTSLLLRRALPDAGPSVEDP